MLPFNSLVSSSQLTPDIIAELFRVTDEMAAIISKKGTRTLLDDKIVALSAGIQTMVRSDVGAAGVLFTLDTETGFRDAVFITSSFGLGETVVQGAVNPDEFYVYKPALAAGKHPILRKNLGSKAIKMVYSDNPKPGQVHLFQRKGNGLRVSIIGGLQFSVQVTSRIGRTDEPL